MSKDDLKNAITNAIDKNGNLVRREIEYISRFKEKVRLEPVDLREDSKTHNNECFEDTLLKVLKKTFDKIFDESRGTNWTDNELRNAIKTMIKALVDPEQLSDGFKSDIIFTRLLAYWMLNDDIYRNTSYGVSNVTTKNGIRTIGYGEDEVFLSNLAKINAINCPKRIHYDTDGRNKWLKSLLNAQSNEKATDEAERAQKIWDFVLKYWDNDKINFDDYLKRELFQVFVYDKGYGVEKLIEALKQENFIAAKHLMEIFEEKYDAKEDAKDVVKQMNNHLKSMKEEYVQAKKNDKAKNGLSRQYTLYYKYKVTEKPPFESFLHAFIQLQIKADTQMPKAIADDFYYWGKAFNQTNIRRWDKSANAKYEALKWFARKVDSEFKMDGALESAIEDKFAGWPTTSDGKLLCPKTGKNSLFEDIASDCIKNFLSKKNRKEGEPIKEYLHNMKHISLLRRLWEKLTKCFRSEQIHGRRLIRGNLLREPNFWYDIKYKDNDQSMTQESTSEAERTKNPNQ